MLKKKRVLYKISGEFLSKNHSNYDVDVMLSIAKDVKVVHDTGAQIAIVIGAGNICRGVTMSTMGLNRLSGDHMGMLATIMNGIALKDIISKNTDLDVRVMSAIPVSAICEQYKYDQAIRHLEKSRVVIFVAGIGNPFFTTDMAAALRASEIGCDCIYKGTSVNGIYSADPKNDLNAKRYSSISYDTAIRKQLKFMDEAAIRLVSDTKIPVVVFSIRDHISPFAQVMNNKGIYTLLSDVSDVIDDAS